MMQPCGADVIAHSEEGEDNTIAIVANRLDIHYPTINKNLIAGIEKEGLLLRRESSGTNALLNNMQQQPYTT